jgi:hypothetical protein
VKVFLQRGRGFAEPVPDLIIDRKRRLIGDEFYSRNGLLTGDDIDHLPNIESGKSG